jgi:metallo-beta-lactamase family protein
MPVSLTFHGACGTVTGSCFEVRTKTAAVLIDCGMFQGTKTVKALNYEAFGFEPGKITSVILTHAHIDHCGLVPKLTGSGFHGPIYATPGTADLLTYILPDSGYIQETEVERLNRRNRQRGIPSVEPIYTRAGAEAALHNVKGQPFSQWFAAAPGIRARFWNAGHILGSASVEIEARDTPTSQDSEAISILFSGDIGPGDKAFHESPKAPSGVDFVVMESTYGDRIRARRTQEQRIQILERELKAALRAGGVILIPAFAVERTQELLFDLDVLFDSGKLPSIPVFVDSPLATHATDVFAKHLGEHANSHGTHAFRRHNLRFVASGEDSKKLNRLRGGAIILAGSGMCDAGRIRHHLKAHLSRADTTLILAGYQAPSTLGRLLYDGEKVVRIHGEEIAVAARIRMLDEYSGHADQPRLLKWFQNTLPLHHDVFLVHGEEPSRLALAELIKGLGTAKKNVRLPVIGETVRLSKTDGAKTTQVRASVQPGDLERDWHNAYASTVIALKQKLSTLGNDSDRRRLLQTIERTVLKPPTRRGRKR